MKVFRITITTNYLCEAPLGVEQALKLTEAGAPHGPIMLENVMREWKEKIHDMLTPGIDGIVRDVSCSTDIKLTEVQISLVKSTNNAIAT